MGKIATTEIETWMEGLTEPLLITADQRDYAAVEAQDIPEESYATRLRWIAWHAGKRQGKVTVDWKTFNGSLCIQCTIPRAEDDEQEESEDGQSLDPGRTEASAA